MSNFSGLQIDPHCIRCGKPPTANVPLLEMRNHLYICDQCRQDEERKGKQIAWAEGATSVELPGMLAGSALMTRLLAPNILTTQLSANSISVPKNSLFGVLGVPLSASQSDVENAIDEKMIFWMQEANSDERQRMIDQLREWQEAIVSDPEFLQKQVNRLQPRKARGSALIVGGKPVYTAGELLAQCEGSEQGWKDTEELLNKGELHPWILYQIGDRVAANDMDRLVRANTPTYRVLNYVLYRLVPDRPFRLYSREVWQSVTSVPEAQTSEELAQQCDQHWTSGEWHLYQGAMVAWLEFSQGCKGLGQYYETSIRPYGGDRSSRGLGLELLLERIAPKLTRPKLTVAFNGIQDDSYVEGSWDREIPHGPVTVQIDNTTRGFTTLTLEIVRKKQNSYEVEPDWIHLVDARAPTSYPLNAPVRIAGRKESVMPANAQIQFTNLEQLKRGRHYERLLRVVEQREYGRDPVVREYPIVLKTMSYFQGLRGVLWRCGLRGDLPGLVWSGGSGMVLAVLTSGLLLNNASLLSHSRVPSRIGTTPDFISILQPCLAGLVANLRHLPSLSFVLITGILMGIVGFRVGINKDHARYMQKEGAAGFAKGALILSLILLPVLLLLKAGYKTTLNALSHGIKTDTVGVLFYVGGNLLTCLLIFIIACMFIILRAVFETILRARFAP